MNKNKKILGWIAALGFSAVVLGAFGSHWLGDRLSNSSLATFKTGVLYHFVHVLAALGVWTILIRENDLWLKRSILSFIIGIFLFSGSLYIISTKSLLNLTSVSYIGPMTPIGGLFFVLGWTMLFIYTIKK